MPNGQSKPLRAGTTTIASVRAEKIQRKLVDSFREDHLYDRIVACSKSPRATDASAQDTPVVPHPPCLDPSEGAGRARAAFARVGLWRRPARLHQGAPAHRVGRLRNRCAPPAALPASARCASGRSAAPWDCGARDRCTASRASEVRWARATRRRRARPPCAAAVWTCRWR